MPAKDLKQGINWFELEPLTNKTPQRGAMFVAELDEISHGLIGKAPRVYWVINDPAKPEDERGGHYHPEGGKTEILFCMHGTMHVTLKEIDQEDVTITVNSPNKGIYIGPNVWHGVKMEGNAVLMSIASTNYQVDEKISEWPPTLD